MDLTKFKDILSWILLGVSILLVLWYIFGDSPTLEQTLLGILTMFIIRLHATLGKIKGKLNEHLRSHN